MFSAVKRGGGKREERGRKEIFLCFYYPLYSHFYILQIFRALLVQTGHPSKHSGTCMGKKSTQKQLFLYSSSSSQMDRAHTKLTEMC